MLKKQDIRIRDPYIVLENDCYYLFGTNGQTTMTYYTSSNLEDWELGGVAFEIASDSWACKDVWASEVHKYNGKFYLFVSLLGKNGLRGTQIAVADTPAGPYIPIKNGPATPENQSCIDGTLYVEDGIPYIVYSHDWPDCYDPQEEAFIGQICVAQLSQDLTEIIGEPKVMFNSNDCPISKATPDHITWEGKPSIRYGTDGPFFHKLSNGQLLMTWSPYLDDHYVVLGVISKSGKIAGPWEHMDTPLFDKDGGHAMFFRTKEGQLCMSLHAPEAWMKERAHIYAVEETEDHLKVLHEI